VLLDDEGERVEASSAVDSVASLPDASLRSTGSAVRILLADDHETVRRGVRVILAARKEYTLVEVTNGEEAVAAARGRAPDLVILDLTMPSLDGFTAAQEIRKFLPHVPILFFSMHQQSPALLALAKARNVQGFVCKAESGGVLLKAVEALLAKKDFFPPAESL
jgi:DNA-binding NarL/FixJ family response regulator